MGTTLEHYIRAERVFNYFVKHQRGLRPLIFDDPTNPDAARDYLAFLEAMRIQRFARSSRPSEIRFVSYDPATRSPALQQWRRAIPLKSRDEIEPHSDNGPEQRLGILAHFQLAPGRPLVGNMGFRFVMLMGAIAHPMACSPGKPTIFHHSGKL